MFIEENSVKIKVGNDSYVDMGPYLTNVKFGFHKLWNEDSGRALSGKMVGTLKGIFPKLTLSFKPLSRNELETIAPILNSAFQTTRYYDPEKRDYVEMETYSNDWENNNKNIIVGAIKNQPFEWAVIAVEKRR